MNIFRQDKDFIEDCDEVKEMESLQSILTFAKKIKVRLGEQEYLMDRYLSLIFETINSTLAYESASDGFEAGASLRNLCRSILDGDNLETEQPYYEQVKQCIINNPIFLKEKTTKINVYFSCLADDYLNFSIEEFIEHQTEKIQSTLDSIYLNELYCKITAIANTEDVDKLNFMIKQRFLRWFPIDGFIQGFTNDLLYSLTHRDSETNKQVFQLF